MLRSTQILLAIGWLVAANIALADGAGLRPGLWSSRVVKQVVDGRDMADQQADAMNKMQQAMASLSAEQRAAMQGMMQKNGVALGERGSVKICVSKAMAARNKPLIDKSGHCEPTRLVQNAGGSSFEFSCEDDGATMKGKGTSVSSGDRITTHVDLTRTDAKGTSRAMQVDYEMQYLGADCGDIQPLDSAH